MIVQGAVQKTYVGENDADGPDEILKFLSMKIGFNIILFVKKVRILSSADFYYTWCAHGLLYLSPEF